MPSRKSTRSKIRYESEKIIGHLDWCEKGLQNIDELADGQSTYINKFLPAFVNLFVSLKNQWESFNEGL